MPTQVMRGATRLRQQLATYLSANMPPLIEIARTEWGLQSWQLPTPEKYDSYDPLVTHVYPSIGSLVRRTSNWNRMGIRDGEETYWANYSMLIFIWVATPIDPATQNVVPEAYDETLRLRDDSLGIMRSCLLSRPSLGTSTQIMLDESSFNEDYLDAIQVSKESPGWLAGGTLTCIAKVIERNTMVPLGTAQTITVDGQSKVVNL